MKTLKSFSELYTPKSKDEKDFVDKHVIIKHKDANGNGDEVFKASKVKAYKRAEEHGYEPGEDAEVYESKESNVIFYKVHGDSDIKINNKVIGSHHEFEKHFPSSKYGNHKFEQIHHSGKHYDGGEEHQFSHKDIYSDLKKFGSKSNVNEEWTNEQIDEILGEACELIEQGLTEEQLDEAAEIVEQLKEEFEDIDEAELFSIAVATVTGVDLENIEEDVEENLEEDTSEHKDGYYVTDHMGNHVGEVHNDSKKAVRIADKRESATGRVHQVYHLKGGKIQKQWAWSDSAQSMTPHTDYKGMGLTFNGHIKEEAEELDEISHETREKWVSAKWHKHINAPGDDDRSRALKPKMNPATLHTFQREHDKLNAKWAKDYEDKKLKDREAHQPKVHDFRHMDHDDVYNHTQTNEKIKSGDVMKVKGGTAVMLDAWPTMVHGKSKVLHSFKDGTDLHNLDNGTWHKSAKLADQVHKGVKEDLDEGTRLISKHEGKDGHHAEVRYNKEWGEYSVHHYHNGKHLGEGPVSYTDDKGDAQDTAAYETKNFKVSGGRLTPHESHGRAAGLDEAAAARIKPNTFHKIMTQHGFEHQPSDDEHTMSAYVHKNGAKILYNQTPNGHGYDLRHKRKHPERKGAFLVDKDQAVLTHHKLKGYLKHRGYSPAVNEETESLDELSQPTLLSYAKKARKERDSKSSSDETVGKRVTGLDLAVRRNKAQKIALQYEETELEEGVGARYTSFADFKDRAHDLANHITDGTVDFHTREVDAGGKKWHQTSSIIHHNKLGKSFSYGVFNHTGKGASEEGFGHHLTPEELDEDYQIDEVSSATLGRYIDKATKDEDNRRTKGLAVRDEIRRRTGMNVSMPLDRKLYHPKASRDAGKAVAFKKLSGKARIGPNEDVEPIEELSKKTLYNYITKAYDKIGDHGATARSHARLASDQIDHDAEDALYHSKRATDYYRKVANRRVGTNLAVKKLAKEDVINNAIQKYIPEVTDSRSSEDHLIESLNGLSENNINLLVGLYRSLNTYNKEVMFEQCKTQDGINKCLDVVISEATKKKNEGSK